MAQRRPRGHTERLKSFLDRLGFGYLYRPTLVVLVLLALAATILAFIRFWPSSTDEGGVFVTQAVERADGIGPEVQETTLMVIVDVSGAVISPGVYELAEGSRVIDAVKAAGGTTEDADISSVNLARKVVDGEQVRISRAEEVEATSSSGGSSPDARRKPVDINRAGADELTTLDGVGETTARRIVADREANGPFSSPEDIMRVSGIGEGRFAAIKDHIRV